MDSRAPFKASYRHLVRGVYAFTRAQPGTVRLNLMRPYRLQFAQIAKTLSQNQAKNLEQFSQYHQTLCTRPQTLRAIPALLLNRVLARAHG